MLLPGHKVVEVYLFMPTFWAGWERGGFSKMLETHLNMLLVDSTQTSSPCFEWKENHTFVPLDNPTHMYKKGNLINATTEVQ